LVPGGVFTLPFFIVLSAVVLSAQFCYFKPTSITMGKKSKFKAIRRQADELPVLSRAQPLTQRLSGAEVLATMGIP